MQRELIVDEPRVRKRTARYGNNDNLADMSDLGSDSDSGDDDDSRRGKKSVNYVLIGVARSHLFLKEYPIEFFSEEIKHIS